MNIHLTYLIFIIQTIFLKKSSFLNKKEKNYTLSDMRKIEKLI